MKKKLLLILLTMALLCNMIMPGAMAAESDTADSSSYDVTAESNISDASTGDLTTYDLTDDITKDFVEVNKQGYFNADTVTLYSNPVVDPEDKVTFKKGVLPESFTVQYEFTDPDEGKWYVLDTENWSVDDGAWDPKYPYVAKENVAFVEEENPSELVDTILTGNVDGVNVTVSGKMPAGTSLNLTDVANSDGIVFAADIKLMKEDGSQWQPYENDTYVTVSLNAYDMGLVDGNIVTLRHTHEGEAKEYTHVVINDEIIFTTDCFSIIEVSDKLLTKGTIINATRYSMIVGQTRYFYFDNNKGWSGHNPGIWHVSNAQQAIDYEVYDDGYSYAQNGNKYYARWIKVTAKKAGEAVITGEYSSGSTSFTISVSDPEGFHIEDKVTESGCLVPAFGAGWTEDTDGYTYEWARSDGQVIQPNAVQEDGSINISVDRGGVTNGRDPITYTVKAKSADGDEVAAASYEVIYGNEILNTSFENPDMTGINGNRYYYNGYPGLYWKTTAPGKGSNKLTQDIEMIRAGSGAEDSYGVKNAADGNQFVELNAEDFGALYQDILTTPGATLNWSFSHNGRTNEGSNNKMYIVVAATKSAQKIVNKNDITKLINAAGNVPVTGKSFTYDNTTYWIWSHEADNKPSTWENISGSVEIPEGQYLTRLFFASDTSGNGSTMGNLIDAASAGQTMKYKIEYYLDNGTSPDKTQTGNGSVYSLVPLSELQGYLDNGYVLTESKLLQESGTAKDYPGDVRNGLYITDYGASGDREYNIVLRVRLRKKAVVIKKVIEVDGWDKMSEEDKAALIGDGLTAEFKLYQNNKSTEYTARLTISDVSSTGELTTTGEFTDSKGNAPVDGTYSAVEISAPKLDGYSCTTVFTPETVTIDNDNPNAVITCTNSYKTALTSMTIKKTVKTGNVTDENTGSYQSAPYDEDDTFIFDVYDGDDLVCTVSMKNNNSVTINDVEAGKTYTVKERTNHSRYEADQTEKVITPAADASRNELIFDNSLKKIYWLGDSNSSLNIFGTSGN